METNYIEEETAGGVPVKMWTRGVPVEDAARRQLPNAARLPFVFKHVAAMPDVHVGIGATVGSVIPTEGDHPGRGRRRHRLRHDGVRTTLRAEDLPDNLAPLRSAIERAVPHGRVAGRARSGRLAEDAGARSTPPGRSSSRSSPRICRDYPKLAKTNNRPAPRHARHRQPLHRGLPRRGGRGLGHAALGLARRRQRDRHVLHRAGEAGRACAPVPTCPTGTSPTSRKARATSTTTCERSAGRRTSRR